MDLTWNKFLHLGISVRFCECLCIQLTLWGAITQRRFLCWHTHVLKKDIPTKSLENHGLSLSRDIMWHHVTCENSSVPNILQPEKCWAEGHPRPMRFLPWWPRISALVWTEISWSCVFVTSLKQNSLMHLTVLMTPVVWIRIVTTWYMRQSKRRDTSPKANICKQETQANPICFMSSNICWAFFSPCAGGGKKGCRNLLFKKA